jgi:hypothetical protein
MSFTPSEVILGATLPLENGSTITFSVAGHVEGERDYDDAVVIFGRKLLKYTNSASDADRLTVRQVISSITSTPLDKVPDVGTPTPPAPVKEPVKVAPPALAPKKAPWEPKITKSSYDAMQAAKQDAVPTTPPSAEEQAAEAVAQCIKPPADAGDIARQQHADKLKADLERLQADHDTRVARRAATAPDPAPSAPPTPDASAPAAAVTAPLAPKTAPPEGFSLCAECGEAVPANQAKLSQLFQGKTLCKQCMEVP